MLDSSVADGLIGAGGAVLGAVMGSLITGHYILKQTKIMLVEESTRRKEERDQTEAERESERKAVAAALLWEIDDFYKLSIRDVYRFLKDKDPAEIRFETKSLTFRSFSVYQATADKVGLFDPSLIQGVVGFYGTARAYLDTIYDYGRTVEMIQAGQRQYHGKAVELQRQIKNSSESLVPLAKTVCELLAARSGTNYKFDAP